MYDVAIIGGGPAGLAAAINAGAEGLSACVICDKLGGQAGTSSLIENLIGFPSGVSGPKLTSLAKSQADKFGVRFLNGTCGSLEKLGGIFRVKTDGETILARSAIVATGAQYRRLDGATRSQEYEGKGVHYACTAQSTAECKLGDVVVVGGGNSAGQAAMFLSERARHVHLVVRKQGLLETMSAYLLRRIYEAHNITLHFGTSVHEVIGRDRVERVRLEGESGYNSFSVTDVFVMIGAEPNSTFLKLCDLDAHGFVLTDDFYETKTPGLFAVGDIRAGSVKRVANAVGEGSSVVRWVWRYLNPEGAKEAA